MPDGSAMNAVGGQLKTFNLDEAIERLESGNWDDGDRARLDDETVLTIEEPAQCDGLLQRLKAHRRLLALASGDASAAPEGKPKTSIRGDVRILLDAVKQAR